ncbi:hypothetical protein AT575_03320 [Streptococcus penaeicida]|uniref:Uncharacterized protein n=1 Tax=Streptococcus penaeicida TaxID=1765960 RepID=A0A2N8LCP6_9STRE|nr:hypothetical protein [Streptococcus penaeicida]PND47930.1 hypothetical protein AT575_03320 [Streptococcus penaeicida]
MNELTILFSDDEKKEINVFNQNLYKYDFSSYSLVPLQEISAQKVSENLLGKIIENTSKIEYVQKILSKADVQYVADYSDFVKEQLEKGNWKLGVKKSNGAMFGAIFDTSKSPQQIVGQTELKKVSAKDFGNLAELSAIQGQLSDISNQIAELNVTIDRVENGQYNDRYSGFFAGRQLVIEALALSDEQLQRDLLLSAAKTNSETIAKLMLTINTDANEFTNINKNNLKISKKIEQFLQMSLGYLNATLQLNMLAYTALGEKQALIAALQNYNAFLNQTLLSPIDNRGKTLAWKIDNAHEGADGRINQNLLAISNTIESLSESLRIDGDNHEFKKIEENRN